MTWLKLTAKALYLMENDKYLEKQDLIQSRVAPEQYKLDFPRNWIVGVDQPNNLIVALMADKEPKPNLKPPTPSRFTISVTSTKKFNPSGLVILKVALMKGTTIVDEVRAVSGQPNRQAFRLPAASKAGSQEPLPEGIWDLGLPKPNSITKERNSVDKLVEFASGQDNDFSKDWPDNSDGLGPIYIEMSCRQNTERKNIGFHLDNNASESPGTVGCIGIVKDSGLASLRRFVGWFKDKEKAPHIANVDWGLGSLNI